MPRRASDLRGGKAPIGLLRPNIDHTGRQTGVDWFNTLMSCWGIFAASLALAAPIADVQKSGGVLIMSHFDSPASIIGRVASAAERYLSSQTSSKREPL